MRLSSWLVTCICFFENLNAGDVLLRLILVGRRLVERVIPVGGIL